MADSAQRQKGRAKFEEVMGFAAPEIDDPFLDATIERLFAEVWSRGQLTRRERRLITLTILACFGHEPTLALHLRAATQSGDLGDVDIDELLLHLAHYAGWPVAAAARGVATRPAGATLTPRGDGAGRIQPVLVRAARGPVPDLPAAARRGAGLSQRRAGLLGAVALRRRCRRVQGAAVVLQRRRRLARALQPGRRLGGGLLPGHGSAAPRSHARPGVARLHAAPRRRARAAHPRADGGVRRSLSARRSLRHHPGPRRAAADGRGQRAARHRPRGPRSPAPPGRYRRAPRRRRTDDSAGGTPGERPVVGIFPRPGRRAPAPAGRRSGQRSARSGARRRAPERRRGHRLPLSHGHRRQRDDHQTDRQRALLAVAQSRRARARRSRGPAHSGLGRGDAALRRVDADAGAHAGARRRGAGRAAARAAIACCCSSGRRTATSASSPIPTSSTSTATPASTSPSARARTSAWGPRWPASRRASPWRRSNLAYPTTRSTPSSSFAYTRPTCADSPRCRSRSRRGRARNTGIAPRRTLVPERDPLFD